MSTATSLVTMEADDPAFTQPLLYKKIKSMPSISSLLTDQLISQSELEKEQSDQIHQRLRRQLDASLEKIRTVKKSSTFEGSMAVKQIPYDFSPVKTSVQLNQLKKVMTALSSWPEDFRLNSKN